MYLEECYISVINITAKICFSDMHTEARETFIFKKLFRQNSVFILELIMRSEEILQKQSHSNTVFTWIY